MTPQPDIEQIKQTLQLIPAPGSIGEIRFFDQRTEEKKGGIGYFFTAEEIPQAAEIAYRENETHGGYLVMNDSGEALIERPRLSRQYSLTKDVDIARRVWLPIDFDPHSPERGAADSSTDAEKENARQLMELVQEWLRELGFPEPVFADSGNGWHLLYRLDFPNDGESHQLVKMLLDGLAKRFNTDQVGVDISVHNASRVFKLYGTVARKGQDRPDRPHRLSKILSVPDGGAEIVSKELIVKVIRELTAPAGVTLLDREQSTGDEPSTAAGNLGDFTLTKPKLIIPEQFPEGGRHANLIAVAGAARSFGSNEAEILAILRTFNQTRCANGKPDTELQKIARDFARKDCNQRMLELMESTSVDIDAIVGAPAPLPKPPIDDDLLNPGGLLQEIINFNLRTAIKPQPELALAGAIALCATIFGRKVQDDYGTRPNIYIVGISPSGSGKDQARRVNKLLLSSTGGNEMFQDDLASDAGLHVAINASPAVLIQLDEFGRFLAATGNPGKHPWMFKIITVLLKLYSSSGDVYKGPSYADASKNLTVHFPNCVLYGTTVPHSFFASLGTESLSDGFFNRLLIVESSNGDPDPQVPAPFELPYILTETVRWWIQHNPGSGNLVSMVPTARHLISTTDAIRVFTETSSAVRERQRAEESRGTQIWGRCYENARKLALIHQCSLDYQATEISEASANWGCRLAMHLTTRIDQLAQEHVSDGEFDALAKKLLRFVRDGGEGGRTRTEVCRHMRAQTNRQIDELVQKLVSTEEIISGSRPAKSGPAATVFKAIS